MHYNMEDRLNQVLGPVQDEPAVLLQFMTHATNNNNKKELGRIAMNRQDFQMLCEELPILPLLLFGHEKFQQPKSAIPRDKSTNLLLVRMPNFCKDMTPEIFLDLFKCIKGTQALPSHFDSKPYRLMDFLGGCAKIDRHLRSLAEPKEPGQDIQNEYEWEYLGYVDIQETVDSSNDTKFARIINTRKRDGWELVNSPSYNDYGRFLDKLVFRRKKAKTSHDV